MPRAVEIRLDPILKCVVIDTNFPNREVCGASWEPRLFRLGWNTPAEIWMAMQDAVPTLICDAIRLKRPNGDALVEAEEWTCRAIIEAVTHSYFSYSVPKHPLPYSKRVPS